MIEIRGVSKHFGDVEALASLSAEIKDGQVFGLVGTNGSGKSTLLRLIAGILKADEGAIGIDGEAVYENPAVKRQICLLPEEGAFLVSDTPNAAADRFAVLYPAFDRPRFDALLKRFGLDGTRRFRTFSKGMKKQVIVLLGICAGTRYLLCDETFDGLDPVMRQAVKSLFATEMVDRDFTPVIASHNMRELEDICDHVGLLHRGRILLSEDLTDMKLKIQKVQCVLSDPSKENDLLGVMDIVSYEKRGRLMTFVARGDRETILDRINGFEPVFAEALPLTLEEIFISETEVAGYDIRNLFA